MKVLHILNELKYSGAETMLAAGAATFANAGIESHILATGSSVGEYAPILERAGYAVAHVPLTRNVRFFIRLASYVRRNKFDVVHVHAEGGSFWYALTSSICGVHTIVRTIHSTFAFTGFLRLRRSVQRFVMRSILGVIFIAVSEGVKDVEETVFGNRCILIRNWVDRGRFFPAKNGREKNLARAAMNLPANAVVLVSVGSCQDGKNHRAILEALACVGKTKQNIMYLHVGTGPLEKNERRLARDMHLESKARFAGKLNDVRQALIASDIFLMPSRYEGLPVSLLESLATAVPIVAYNSVGVRSVIQDGYNGLLCDPTSEQLANAVLRLEKDRSLKDAIIDNGLKTVRALYSMDESLASLLQLYGVRQQRSRNDATHR